jgi:hypothetical protein
VVFGLRKGHFDYFSDSQLKGVCPDMLKNCSLMSVGKGCVLRAKAVVKLDASKQLARQA